MPGNFINLLPPDLTKPHVSTGKSEPVAVPISAVPKFGKPDILVPDNFWSNLKQFLTERPIKVKERADAPFTRNSFGAGVGDNLKDFFKSGPAPKSPVNNRLAVNWGSNFGGFGYRLKEFFSPTKQPPLPFEVKPVRVKEIWSKDENFGWTQIISFGVHGLVLFLLAIPLIWHFSTPIQAKNNVDVTPLDISPYVAKLPAGAEKAGGGGGANDHSLAPVNKGRLPKFKMTQFTPPQVHPLPNPKLPMDPSLLGPPELHVANNPNLPTFGDPLANGVSDSLGHGNGTGIGSGNGGGLGPGEGGGTGGGAFRAGVNGVGTPQCLYCPTPQYSDEARKAKYQGIVVLQVTITVDGRATDISVVKGPGMGLEEKAIEAVKGWKFRPAAGPNGKLVATVVPIEVTFRLY